MTNTSDVSPHSQRVRQQVRTESEKTRSTTRSDTSKDTSEKVSEMADELERARKARDKKKEKKKRELPKDFKPMGPDDILDMLDEALADNERVINAISGTKRVRAEREGHGSTGSSD
jgi:hypothetical protein